MINIEFLKIFSSTNRKIRVQISRDRSQPPPIRFQILENPLQIDRIDIFFFFTANMKNRRFASHSRCFGIGFAEQERVPAKNSAYWCRVETTPADENYRKIDGVTCVSVSVKVHATTHPTRLEIDAVSESCLLAFPRVFEAVIIAPSSSTIFANQLFIESIVLLYFDLFFTILEIKLRFVNLSLS